MDMRRAIVQRNYENQGGTVQERIAQHAARAPMDPRARPLDEPFREAPARDRVIQLCAIEAGVDEEGRSLGSTLVALTLAGRLFMAQETAQGYGWMEFAPPV